MKKHQIELSTATIKSKNCDCEDANQCWEPCGMLGKNPRYAKASELEVGE